jgi:hypothetical protein
VVGLISLTDRLSGRQDMHQEHPTPLCDRRPVSLTCGLLPGLAATSRLCGPGKQQWRHGAFVERTADLHEKSGDRRWVPCRDLRLMKADGTVSFLLVNEKVHGSSSAVVHR